MPDLEFWSHDKRFGLKVTEGCLAAILSACRDSRELETGGVLVGHYTGSLDCAVVTSVSGAPKDSRSGVTWFERGVRGLQGWLDSIWTRHCEYYLGEWHLHPGAAPEPSGCDIRQMKEFAASSKLSCPEPLLLIIGGDPNGDWKAKAFVFPRNRGHQELVRGAAGSSSG